jgi:signal transduction histidine kinase
MSHELRTPLNSILGFSGILLQDMAGPLNDEQRRQIGMVSSAGRHLLALINDVLDLSRIEAGQMQIGLELFSPSDAATSVVESLAPLAADRGLVLAFEDRTQGLHIQSDPMRFQQILLNLLGNAIKFTEEGSVTLSLERDGTGVRAVVADTGPGIAADVLSNVFEDFYQVPRSDGSKTVGTGLGLPVSRKLAEMLGGTLIAGSSEGGGSVFTLSLPGTRAST